MSYVSLPCRVGFFGIFNEELIRWKSPTLSFNLPSSAVKYKINVR